MTRPISQKPAEFSSSHEEEYWHSAQDVAFRAGTELVLRGGQTFLVFEDHEQIVCIPDDPRHIWFEAWRRMNTEFPLLSLLWVGGRALTKPGEMEQIRQRGQVGGEVSSQNQTYCERRLLRRKMGGNENP